MAREAVGVCVVVVVVAEVAAETEDVAGNLLEPAPPEDLAACFAARPGIGSRSFFLFVVLAPVLVGAAPVLAEEVVVVLVVVVEDVPEGVCAEEVEGTVEKTFPGALAFAPPCMAAAKDEVLGCAPEVETDMVDAAGVVEADLTTGSGKEATVATTAAAAFFFFFSPAISQDPSSALAPAERALPQT